MCGDGHQSQQHQQLHVHDDCVCLSQSSYNCGRGSALPSVKALDGRERNEKGRGGGWVSSTFSGGRGGGPRMGGGRGGGRFPRL